MEAVCRAAVTAGAQGLVAGRKGGARGWEAERIGG